MVHIAGEIVIDRAPDEVFDFVADERNEPRFNPRMLRAEQVSEGPIGLGTRFRAEAAYAAVRFRRPLLPDRAVPPSETDRPIMKPKLYQLPLLCTSYTFTWSLNSDTMNVIGAMAPCHRPSQKPA